MAFRLSSGFSLHPGMVGPDGTEISIVVPPLCVSTMTTGEFVYKTCRSDGTSQLRVTTIGKPETLVYTETVTHVEGVEGQDPSTSYETKIVTSTIEGVLADIGKLHAPPVQLVWRPEDLPSTSSPTPTATSSPDSIPDSTSGLSAGATAGIAIGVVLSVILLAAGIFLWFRQRKRKLAAAATAPTDDPPVDNGPNTQGAMASTQVYSKAELDAVPINFLVHQPHSELPGHGVLPTNPASGASPMFELDAGGPAIAPVSRPGSAVSHNNNDLPPATPYLASPTLVSEQSSQPGSPGRPPPQGSPSLLSTAGTNSYIGEGWRVSVLRE